MSETKPVPPSPAPAPPAPSKFGWLVPVACLLALMGIGLSVMHFLIPTPLFFALFMIFGQGAFGLAMAFYLVAVLLDLRAKKIL